MRRLRKGVVVRTSASRGLSVRFDAVATRAAMAMSRRAAASGLRRARDGRLHAACSLRVNGVEWMANDTGIAFHSWGAMLERASRDSRIVPGDLLGSGTVTGGSIGEAIRDLGKPARYLQPGDVVEVEVPEIGVLRNTVVPA